MYVRIPRRYALNLDRMSMSEIILLLSFLRDVLTAADPAVGGIMYVEATVLYF